MQEVDTEPAQTRAEENVAPFPGGPIETSLLLWHGNRVAHDLWVNKERGTLRCIQHSTKLDAWSIVKMPCKFKSRIKMSGFWPLARVAFRTINRVLVLPWLRDDTLRRTHFTLLLVR